MKKISSKNILIVGAGSFGTALSVIANNNNHKVSVFDVDKKLIDHISKNRINNKYLPEIKLNKKIFFTNETENLTDNYNIVLFAVPTQVLKIASENIIKNLTFKNDTVFVNVSKGIDIKSLKLPFEIIYDVLEKNPKTKKLKNNIVHLAGPSHAEEVSKNIPTTLLSSSDNKKARELALNVFTNKYLRIYLGDDILGSSLAGAVKNVIALGCGISDGLGLGDNTKAAIITRGLNEMILLGKKLGSKNETFTGLTGVGDLIVTCTSMHSRNRRAGILIGKGVSSELAVKKVGMVVEGMSTSKALIKLIKKYKLDLPICESIYKVCYKNLDPKLCVERLMNRKIKMEKVGK